MHFAPSNREQKWCTVSEAQCVKFVKIFNCKKSSVVYKKSSVVLQEMF